MAALFSMIIGFSAGYRRQIGITEPIDFIFDKHGSQAQVEAGYRRMVQDAPTFLPELGNPPRFKNDTKFLPFQAADLLAWHVRKHWLKYGTIVENPLDCLGTSASQWMA